MNTYPISEVFGPTIQGEGPMIGKRTFFVRFAGCDFDCSWCDTKYAVLPKYPGWHKDMMTAAQIFERVAGLGAGPLSWITLTGGNPALFVDEEFSVYFASRGYRLQMETQGSVEIPAGVSADLAALVVSPKPPSSGMDIKQEGALRVVQSLVSYRRRSQITALKYVVFSEPDLEWIADYDEKLGVSHTHVPRYLQAGTALKDQIEDDMVAKSAIHRSLYSLGETVKNDPRFREFTVLPQMHVLMYGRKKGV